MTDNKMQPNATGALIEEDRQREMPNLEQIDEGLHPGQDNPVGPSGEHKTRPRMPLFRH